jgi:hypothetical protein
MLNKADNQEMLNMVYRTAFMNPTPGSTVMLDAIHALILRQSNSPDAEEFQQKAFSTMWAVTSQQPNLQDALQRIIAVMLLVIFQVSIWVSGMKSCSLFVCRRFLRMNRNSDGRKPSAGPEPLPSRHLCMSNCIRSNYHTYWNGFSTTTYYQGTAWPVLTKRKESACWPRSGTTIG